MGEVIVKYKVMLDSESMSRIDEVCNEIEGISNSIGAIQIAGTGSQTQIPFFVTACDYTLMGEEFFAASAYLSKQPELIAGITAQDIIKIILVGFILLLIVSRAFFDLGVTEFNLVTWLGL